MAFSDIKIYRDLPIINGFVQLPPCLEVDKTLVTVSSVLTRITGCATTRLSLGSGAQTGAKFGQQEWVRLPAITPNTWYTTDPVAEIGGDS